MPGDRPLATGTERPIFLDESGRRARRVRAACAAGGAAAALWFAAIVSGPVGFGRLPARPPAGLALPAAVALPHAHRTHHAALARSRRRFRKRDT